MKKILILVFIISLAAFNLNALFEDYPSSARGRAMGGAFFTLSDDSDAAFYNPAGLDSASDQLNMGFVQLFNNSYTTVATASSSYRFSEKFGVIGFAAKQLSVEFEDTELSTESTFAITHAFKILKDIHSSIAFGYTINVYDLAFDGYDNQSTVGLNLGAIATMHQRTKLSFTVHNINNPAVGDDNEYELPRKMVTGIAYQPYSGITTSLELTKELKEDTSIAAGIEYQVVKGLKLRVGVNTNPSTYSTGVGFNIHDFIVNYGLTYHSDLDATHHIQVGYRF
ncbi:MAG: hypothetical protein B6226_03295 [Candidatus Cloacimonetes bacterium 4572_65]|nr:MAG: hypothetical protein B6226_03295 [Candidatus Cloacimonetes bacterium 4572_65]